MSFEFRSPKDFFQTVLKVAAQASDTTLTSDGFVNLPSTLSSAANGQYIPAALVNQTTGEFEIVWISGHSSGSNVVTVVRGREGTTNLPWGSNTIVVVAPTTRDVLMYVALASAVPADLHIGARVARKDKLDVVEKGKDGLYPSVGMALAEQVGPNPFGVMPPDGAVITERWGHITGNTDGNGDLQFNYRAPFPNATGMVTFTSTLHLAEGPFLIAAATASGCRCTIFHGGARLVNQAATFGYRAVGW